MDNYWSWNFNTPSTLLAGAVTAGGAGPSSIFYNPALIDHDNVASLSLSTNIISVQFYKIKNVLGEGIDAGKINLKIQPRFFSYVLPTKNKRLGLEAAFLSPVSDEIEFNIQHFAEIEVIKRMEGLETFSGYMDYARKEDDSWAGFGLSYHLAKGLYVGSSAFISYKKLKYRNSLIAHAFQEKDSVVVNQDLIPAYIVQNSFEEELKYWDAGLIFKFGAQYQTKNEKFSIGFNLTLPTLSILGQADVRKAFNRSNVFDDSRGNFTPNDVLIEHDLNARTNIKTPFSAALGFQIFTDNKENFIAFNLEYFNKIDPYPIFKTTTDDQVELPLYLSKYLGVNAFLPYYHEAKSVTNAAVGLKQFITPTLFIFGGFRTDFSAGTIDNTRYVGDKFKVSQIHMNKYHFTIGTVLNIRRSEVVTGIQYSFGRSKNLENIINFAQPVEYIPSSEQALEGMKANNMNVNLNELSLFLGITVDLFLPNDDTRK